MHCNLKYPTENNEINLRMIENLKEYFPDCVIGLSDHTINLWTPAFSYALGANVVEKHYTIDKNLDKSADHWLSVDPKEVTQIIENILTIYNTLIKARPPSVKGQFLENISISSTMGPGLKLDKTELTLTDRLG